MHKDMLGRVVEVGDAICWSSSGSGVEVSIVTKIMPKTVKINNGGSIYSQYALVVNEQMIASGQGEKLEKMRDENKKHYDATTPIVRPKNPTFRYSLVFVGDPNAKVMSVYLAKLPHDNNTPATKPWREVEKDLRASGFIFNRERNGYSHRSYDSMRLGQGWKVANDYYAPQQSLLLRDIKTLGLEPHIDQLIDIDVFKTLVAGQITGLKYPDFFN